MSSKPITPRAALTLAHVQYMAQTSTMPFVELQGIAKNKPRKLGTTNGITAAIIDYVTYTGGFANRISSAGRKIIAKSGKEIFIKGTTKSGTPDIDIVVRGMAIKVEIKNANTKDRISPEQSKVKIQLESAGAIYFIAESFDSFYYWYTENIIKEIPPVRA